MKTAHTISRGIIMAGIGFIAAFGVSDKDAYADTSRRYGYVSEAPFTSLKCNEFTFDATESRFPPGANAAFLWDFGDGTTSTEPVVTHTYEQSGDYTVNLSVTDNSGFECSMGLTSRIVRANIPPHASFISKDRACVNEPITLDAGTSYDDNSKVLGYSWNFGDGTTLEGNGRVEKTYPKGGDYKVLLTVDDRSATACSARTTERIVHINEPPAARAGDDVILRCVDESDDITIDFDASATTDINHDPLTYVWDFGDGYKEAGIKVSHRYEKAGNYDVRLIVSDNTNLDCGTGVDFVTVKLNRTPRADAGDDAVVCAGEDIGFDGSDSYIHKKGTAAAQWFFGDGTSAGGLRVTHRYSGPGTYRATLSLENKLNIMCPVSRDTRVVTVNSPPAVGIKSLTSACAGKEIFFDASSAIDADGDDLAYYWNFGDGTVSRDGAKVTHEYPVGGDYRVSVIVDDKRGTTCSTATASVGIHINTPPVADAGPNLSCCTGKEAVFTAVASSDPDGDRLTYAWDFGDGSKAQGETATHTYTQPGSYSASLTVDDHSASACGQSTDSFTAVVKEVPVPAMNIR